jgi:S-formylglutathione hydrolase FrmB
MRRLIAVLAVGLAGCGQAAHAPPRPQGAAIVREQRVGPRMVDLTVRSPALGRIAKVRLLLPDRGSAPRPVVYLLHGCCDSYQSWTRSGDAQGVRALRRALVVMPEGGQVGFYSDWRDGPRWEAFHTRELPALVEHRYGGGGPRAIAGLSMGGLGAMDYAARHPGMYTGAASFSGVLHPLAEPKIWLGLFSAYTPDPLAVWGDPAKDRVNWAAHDPTELAPRLRGVRLFVSSGSGPGDGTEALVGRESREFARALRQAGVTARLHLYRGGRHDWPYWRRELRRALPTLLTARR